tara:strand:+ start:79 stop:180 length:102 start_codon:yes stop_codon:yes gene_type:complete
VVAVVLMMMVVAVELGDIKNPLVLLQVVILFLL